MLLTGVLVEPVMLLLVGEPAPVRGGHQHALVFHVHLVADEEWIEALTQADYRFSLTVSLSVFSLPAPSESSTPSFAVAFLPFFRYLAIFLASLD